MLYFFVFQISGLPILSLNYYFNVSWIPCLFEFQLLLTNVRAYLSYTFNDLLVRGNTTIIIDRYSVYFLKT